MVSTEGASVLVRGTATAKSGKVVSVQVNGVEATTADGFANWQVRVSLVSGENKLKASVKDSAGNLVKDAAEVTVITSLLLSNPRAFALDEARNRVLVADAGLRAVVAIDLTSGQRKILSDQSTYDSVKPLGTLTAIAVDEVNGRALIVDSGSNLLIAVDLLSGAHTTLSSATSSNGNGNFPFTVASESIAIDQLHNRALITDSGTDTVIAVDLTSGARTRFAGVLEFPVGIAVDADNNRALVLDKIVNGVMAINLDTGDITPISSNKFSSMGPLFDQPIEIAFDAEQNRALVSQGDRQTILAVNLATGERTMLSGPGEPYYTNGAYLADIVMDKAHKRALVLDLQRKEVLAVDLVSGLRTSLSAAGEPYLTQAFLKAPQAVAFDRGRNRALILDKGQDGLVAVDLTTGKRSLFSVVAPLNIPYPNPAGGIAMDIDRNRALIVDGDRNAVIAVDLNSGTRSILSDGQTATGKIVFTPYSISLDLKRHRALVLDYQPAMAIGTGAAVVAVDLIDGSRTTLSKNEGFSDDDYESNFSWPHDIVVDTTGDRALVVDNGTRNLLAVNLDTGVRTVITGERSSAPSTATAPTFANPYGIAFDSAHNRALVADKGRGALLAVDLTDGSRTVISGMTTPSIVNQLQYPIFTALDPIADRALVVDGIRRAIVEVDLVTGERVFLVK